MLFMDKLKLLSLNTRGLRDNCKRKKMFTYLKTQKADIYFLQETHSCDKDAFMWNSMWGNECIFSHGASNARGVGILLSKKIKNTICEIRRDLNGRYVMVKLIVNDSSYCLANIYAPNTDNPEFFEEVFVKIKELDCDYIVLGGDFNVALNPMEDRNDDKKYNQHAHEVIESWCEQEDIVDVWRIQHPEAKRFTWVKMKPKITWSRIDYFLISRNLVNLTNDSEIVPCTLSDHSAVIFDFELCDSKQGPGVWKFNNQFLDDEKFIMQTKQVIEDIKKVHHYMNDNEFWEFLKSQIVIQCKDYARNSTAVVKHKRHDLYKLLAEMQEKMARGKTNDAFVENMTTVHNELKLFEEDEAKRAAFRCKVNWETRGELPNSYFFNPEKWNSTSKVMYKVRKKDGTLTKNYKEILDVQCCFFKDLYARDEKTKFDIQNRSGVQISNVQKAQFEEQITEEELFDAMMTLKAHKTPGCDGLTLLFYRKFWKDLVTPLHRSLIESTKKGHLNWSARKGLIKLIPKKRKDDTYVASWRPISLLNYDFKLYAKCIANRLEMVIDQLVGKQQTGFVKGRKIMFNIRRTAEIISYMNKSNQPGIIAMIDFEKCFDRIDHDSISGVFKYFNFGTNFTNMVMLLYRKFLLCTCNNGYVSQFFEKCRGINQGCPGSPIVYTLCGEILNHLVQQNRDIKGVLLRELQNILSQFADDTAAFLKYEQLCVNAFGTVLQCVEAQMGLKVSYEKTTMYRIGSLKDTNAILYTAKDFAWSNSSIETLGVKLKCDGTLDETNYEDILVKVENTCKSWANRKLSLTGKVLVINTLMASQFVYKLMSLANMTREYVNRFENIVKNYLWGNGKPKISLATLQAKREQCGLRLVNIVAKQKTCKIAWLKVIENDTMLAELMFKELCPVLRMDLWKCNLSVKDAKVLFNQNSFWGQTIMAWCEINFHTPKSKNDILHQILWRNSFIKINKQTVIWKSWIEQGIMFVSDIMDTDGSAKERQEIGNVNWLEYHCLFSSIPVEWKEKCKEQLNDGELRQPLFSKLLETKNLNRMIYDLFIDNKDLNTKYRKRWNEDNTWLNQEEYTKSLCNYRQCTKIVKLHDFQY